MIGEFASEAFDKAMVMFWLFLGFMGVMFVVYFLAEANLCGFDDTLGRLMMKNDRSACELRTSNRIEAEKHDRELEHIRAVRETDARREANRPAMEAQAALREELLAKRQAELEAARNEPLSGVPTKQVPQEPKEETTVPYGANARPDVVEE